MGSETYVQVWTVGTSEVALVPSYRGRVEEIILKAPASNTNVVFVGAAGVTGASDGFPLAAGEQVTLAIDSSASLAAIAGAASQTLVLIAPKA